MKKGYTLTEMLVVMFIVGVVSSGLFMVLSSGKQTWETAETKAALQLELRKAIARISDDLKQTSMNQTYTDSGLTTRLTVGGVYPALYFKVPQGINSGTGAIIWNSSTLSYTLNGGILVRSDGAGTLNISSNITALNFSRLANDVIQINVSATKVKAVEHGNATVSAMLQSAVAVRN